MLCASLSMIKFYLGGILPEMNFSNLYEPSIGLYPFTVTKVNNNLTYSVELEKILTKLVFKNTKNNSILDDN